MILFIELLNEQSSVVLISLMDTPVPIPNTEVKHYGAEGSSNVRISRCHANKKAGFT